MEYGYARVSTKEQNEQRQIIAQAVSWAVENGITTGVGGGHFDPTATCTRAQIAAFLARSMK